MSTQRKIVTVFIISVLVALLCVAALAKMNNRKKKSLIDFNYTQLQQNAKSIIDFENSFISRTVFDYTYWDEFVTFMNEPDINWAEDNISTILGSFNFDAVWVLNISKEFVYSAYNSDHKSPSRILFSNDLLEKLYSDRFISYAEYTDAGLLLIHGATIHSTNDPVRRSDPSGYFLVAKLWDDNLNQKAMTLSGSMVTTSKQPHASCNQLHDNTIIVSVPLFDANKQVSGYVTFARELNFLQLYNASSSSLLIMFVSGVLLVLLMQATLLNRWVSRPLRKVGDIILTENTSDIMQLKKCSSDFNRIASLIEDFIRQKKELVIEKQRAQESDRLKSAFLANMSHEVRTPLNGILGFTELLLEDETDEETRRSYLTIVQKSGYSLLNIVNDIVDQSKIEAGQMKLNVEEFNLTALLDDILLLFRENRYVKERHLKLLLNNAFSAKSVITADQLRLKQILCNLMNNASKYTLEGSVELGCSMYDERNILFYVKDTGVGIPHDDIRRIFNRFVQIDNKQIQIPEGTGLGLPISKGLVELMGGKLWVESETNVGSTFSFTLPAVVIQDNRRHYNNETRINQ